MRLYYDFHLHTALSPCADDDMTPNNIVCMAKLKGLDAIAITDHNSVKNARAAMAVGEANGVTVLPGMEIETSEEVHVVALFPTIEAAEQAEAAVWQALPPIDNRKEIFGNQLIIDENDMTVGEVDRMLVIASSLSIDEVFELARSLGGTAFPAHADRSSYSVLSNLGFIPESLHLSHIEISKNITDAEEYIGNTPAIKGLSVVRSSDAHRLGDIAERDNYIDVPENTAHGIIDVLSKT